MNHVFVWRPEDILGALCLAIIVIGAFIYIICHAADALLDRVRRWRRRIK